MQKLVTSHASALGVPEEYVFLPLLSCVAGAMGRAEVSVSEEWRERCALWCAVVGRRGSKRTATLNRFIGAANQPRHPSLDSPLFTHAAVAELLSDIKDDVHMNTILHEDLSQVLDVLLKDSKVNLSRLKRLYDSTPSTGGTPALNMAGFVVAEDAQTFMETQTVDLLSRFLIACPPDVLYYSKDLKVPMPNNTPSLSEILDVLHVQHSEPRLYSLTGNAKLLFNQYYDRYIETLRDLSADARRYCHVAKAPGQLVRLSCVLCALRQALKYVVYQEDINTGTWNFDIGQEDVEASKIIVDQVLKTKFSLLDARPRVEATDRHSPPPQTPVARPPQPPSAPSENNIPVKRQRMSSESSTGHSPGSQTYEDRNEPVTTVAVSQQMQQLNENGAMYQHQPPYTHTALSYAGQQLNNLLRAAAMQRSQLMAAQAVQAAQQGHHVAPPPPQPSSEPTPRHTVYKKEYEPPTTPQQNNQVPVTWPSPSMTPGNGNGTSGHGGNSSDEQSPTHSSGGNNPNFKHESAVRAFYRNNMDQPLGLFDEDPKKFIEEHGVKLKKLLEFRMDYRISPSTCAQRHLIPPLSRTEMLKFDTQTKYPVQVAKEFLLKVAQLGFGSIETVIHPANKRRSSFFQKYPFDQLAEEPKAILTKLNISESDYMAAFLPNGGRDAVYGFPFSAGGHLPSMVPLPSSQYSMASPGTPNSETSTHSTMAGMSSLAGVGGTNTTMSEHAHLYKAEPLDMHDSDDDSQM